MRTQETHKLKVDQVSISSLTPYERNARVHTRKHLQQIANSIHTFGFTCPILYDQKGGIIAGHGRVEAAKLLGWKKVPGILLSHLTEEQKRAYIIADNRLTEIADWDENILAAELQFLSTLDLDFDITVTGFEMAEIDLMIQNLDETGPDEDDEVPEADPEAGPVTQPGDLWLLGEHRLLCADALKEESYKQLLDGKKAHMVFTDPPYNVPIDGYVCGKGKVKHQEFAMASGEMTEAEFTAFLNTTLRHMVKFSNDGSIHFVCMDWRHLTELLQASRSVYSELKNLCVWNKDNGGMGSLYRSKHELVLVYKNGEKPHTNNVELGKNGRYRTNVWDYPGINSLRKGRAEELAMHPTVKPVAMVADAILDCSKRGGIILDPFGGSGTTLMAAERTGRKARLLEMEPRYVDTIIRRWQQKTGRQAKHAESNTYFDAKAKESIHEQAS